MADTDTDPQGVLPDRDLDVLRVGCATYRRPGQVDNAIRDLGWDQTRFYQRLNQLLDDPRALLVDPVNVHRLQRLRDHKIRRPR